MPRIYRIRYIPSETIDLSSDRLLYRDENYLITEWEPIRPRDDVKHGISCVFLNKGWKISAFLSQSRELMYWYCDIVDIQYNKEADIYYLYDLLTDIRIMPDGRVEVFDLDELATAFETSLITERQLLMSLRQSSELLGLIYSTDLPEYVKNIIEEYTGIGVKL
jgi:predicted RNA-binding protein associated with RNAse of E/G family